MHGANVAFLFAKEIALRCDWYYGIWLAYALDDMKWKFPPEDLASYVESPEFTEYMNSFGETDVIFQSGQAVRGIQPR